MADDMAWVWLLNILLQLGVPILTVVFALVVGTIIERRHYASIREREKKFLGLPAVPNEIIEEGRGVVDARMVCGSICVSIDYFKRFLAGLRNIVGGRVRSYESLVDRGRREAILRMKEECPDADIIVNFRMETATIAKTGRRGKESVSGVEVLAYGTALKYGEPRAS